MSERNYESQWWGMIYDQMMAEQPTLVAETYRFYQTQLATVQGPVLECACGTGLFLLPLLAAGHDIVGFDISQAMLTTLRRKAALQGMLEIDRRLSVQEFESFHYTYPFAAIIIPTNTFSMLTTQAAQIRTLKNIYNHLQPGGKLLLDFRIAGMRDLVDTAEGIHGRWHLWTHTETGKPIRQRIVCHYDFRQQLVYDHCFIEYEGEAHDFPMVARWIYKDEFQLLLRVAGFTHWEVFGTPEGDPVENGLDEAQSYWVVHKS